MSLETKIWRQVQNGPNLDRNYFFGCYKNLMADNKGQTSSVDGRTDGRLKEWRTLDKRSVELIPANGKQSDNKGQTSSATDGRTNERTN